jgi:hypothetical protein
MRGAVPSWLRGRRRGFKIQLTKSRTDASAHIRVIQFVLLVVGNECNPRDLTDVLLHQFLIFDSLVL